MGIILKALWLLLPAGIANVTPPLLRRVNILNYPIDFGVKFRGRHLFGKNKTYRGFLFGIISAIFVAYIQKFICEIQYPELIAFSIIDYSSINILILGFLSGFGSLFGDLVGSFLKRRLGILSGKPWIPFDQSDWILGSLFFLNLYINIPWIISLTSLLLFISLHFAIKWIGFYLGINESKL